MIELALPPAATVLVTGPSGFIGSHCLRHLASQSCVVHAVNRSGHGPDFHGRVAWHAADLRDAAAAGALMAQVRPTHLLHCAWIATPGEYGSSPENIDWLLATRALARAFGENGGRRFVGIGSSVEYSPGDTACVEDATPILPASLYGKCKAAAWLALQAEAQLGGFAAAWGRLFLPYGPGDSARRLVPTVLAALQAGRVVDVTSGLQLRDFIYAPDAADLLVRLLGSDRQGAFNVGTGTASTVRSVVERLARAFDGEHLLRFGAVQPAASDPHALFADLSKVRAELEWSPPTSLETGLEQAMADCRIAATIPS